MNKINLKVWSGSNATGSKKCEEQAIVFFFLQFRVELKSWNTITCNRNIVLKLGRNDQFKEVQFHLLQAINFLCGHMVPPTDHQLHQILNFRTTWHKQRRWCQHCLIPALPSSLLREGERQVQRAGGRDDKRIYHSCLQWLRPTALLCIPRLGIHVKIASFLWILSLVGETEACLVLQRHRRKSAASSTAQPKSCFTHAHFSS